MHPKQRLKLIKIAVLVLIIIFLIHWMVKYISKMNTPPIAAPMVVIQKPEMSEVTEYVTQTGSMVAFNSVDLVARIKGYLEAIEFTDGTFIKKGKALFTIEPLPYLEQLKAAEATVVATKASNAYDVSEYRRQQNMYKQNATSLNSVEMWSAKSQESKAQIDKTVADAENARINYSYTHVQAPFDGRIGRHLVDVGNLVGNGAATKLATIEQIDPIYVYFNLNELDLIRIRTAARINKFNPEKISEIPVYVNMQNETNFSHQGKLNFVNTGLNASTGTMEFRALLSNKDYALLPGLFVQVRIPLSKPAPQLMIPDTAVLYDQIGAYVFIMDENNYVRLQRVVLGALEQDKRAIIKGLTIKNNVIISGIQNAIPGNQVTPTYSGNKQP